MNIPISISQMDQLNNVKEGLDSVQWLCYLAVCAEADSDEGAKTAKAVYSMLEPWASRLDDVLEELELARRECKERKAAEKE